MFGKRTALSAVAAALLFPALAAAGSEAGASAGPDLFKNRRCIAACRVESRAGVWPMRARRSVRASRAVRISSPRAGGVCARRGRRRLAAPLWPPRAPVSDPCQDQFRPLVRACAADGHDCAGECPFIGEPSR